MFFHLLLRLSAVARNAKTAFALPGESGVRCAFALDDAGDQPAPKPLACGTAAFSVYWSETEAKRRKTQIA
jgi:hypothetical protein